LEKRGVLPETFTSQKNQEWRILQTIINNLQLHKNGERFTVDSGNMRFLDMQSSHRISTRTRVKGKKLVPIQVAKVRPTNPMDWGIKKIIDSPLCLIRDSEEDCYYIADGNHRFFTKLLVQKIESIKAWVLEEGDQQGLHGNPLPEVLQDWKNGFISLKQLFYMARAAYEINMNSINKDLDLCRSW
jgi:hypothetical protein